MIASMLRLSLRAEPGSRAPLVLPVIAFATVTMLLVAVIGGAQSFFTWHDDLADIYQVLAAVALALLTIPLVTLGGAAARLSARRRDDRLATFRLLGATGRAVTVVTVIESAVLALAGASLGIALSFGVQPLIGLIPFRGEPLGLLGVLLPWWGYVAVLLGVTVIAAVSSMLGLRGVIISPLGVRTREHAPRLSFLRVVIAVLVVAAAFGVTSMFGSFAVNVFVTAGMLVLAFGGTMAVLNAVGPYVLSATAKRQARKAQTADRLIAARRVADDPKAAWRNVSGVAMASFIAVFAGVTVAISADVDDGDAATDFLMTDMRTGMLITVVGSFLMVACAAAVTQAAQVLDRRDLARSLVMLGMPLGTLERSRTRAVMSPLCVASIGSALTAAVLFFPLVGIAAVMAPISVITIILVLAVGIALVRIALYATAPLAREVASAS